MKTTSQLIILVLTFLVLSPTAYAQSPREQLQQMVEQLQKTPNDNALRERIIKLGAEIRPAPAIPEEANRAYVKGGVFKEEAKDPSGYDLAISAYRDALRVAPWWADAYFNLGVTLGLTGKFDEGIASLRLSMASVPAGSAEAREAQNRIYAIEAKAEIASRQTKAPDQQAAAESHARRIVGTWYKTFVSGRGAKDRVTITIRHDVSDRWRIESSILRGVREVQFTGSELRFRFDMYIVGIDL